MGSSLWNTNHKVSMVTDGGNALHQLLATTNMQPFAKKKQNKSKLNILLRINNTTAVAYINRLGGDNLKRTGQSNKGYVDVVSGKKHTHHGSTLSRNSEHHCRCRIIVANRQDGLEAVSLNIPQNTVNLWST